MKKKYYAVIIIVLLSLCLFLIFRYDSHSTLRGAGKYFAVRDTMQVSQIEIRGQQTVVLARQDGTWELNDSLPADPVAVNNFLFVFNRMRIKGIADKRLLQDNKNYISIHIHEKNREKVILFFNINGMELLQKKGEERSYITEIPGFPDVKISDVISDDQFSWRDRLLLSMKPGEISEINVHYPGFPDKDFSLINSDDSLVVYDPVDKFFYYGERVDKEKLRMFMSYFMQIYFEGFISEKSTNDSILNVLPEMQIIIKGREDVSVKLEIFPVCTDDLRNGKYIYIRKNDSNEIMTGKHVLADLWGKERGDFIVN